MAQAIITFIFIFVTIVLLRAGWKVLTREQKFECTKIVFRGIIISVITLVILSLIVILF